MTADEILAAIAAEVADDNVPSLASIHERMIEVEELADEYVGRSQDRYTADDYPKGRLLDAMLSAHETFRDWIGAYS